VEVIVVDNEGGGEDGGEDGAGPRPPLPPEVRLVACAAPGSYAARNAGAAAARGSLLVFTDADCRPEPGWLRALAAAHAETPGALLAGPVRMIPPAAPSAAACFDLARGIPQESYVRRGYAATANLAAPASVFRALGGFDARRFSGGDAEFCRRARAAGHPLRLAAAAAVGHPCRDSWAALAAKARRVKGGQIAAGPLPHRALWTLRTRTPPLRALSRFVRAPLPRGQRLRASAVLFALWGVELGETLRLLAGGRPARE
jgi:hypothetical protein